MTGGYPFECRGTMVIEQSAAIDMVSSTEEHSQVFIALRFFRATFFCRS